MAEPYGGIVLGRSSKDISQKTKLNPGYVQELKKDLYSLGFRIVGSEPYNGEFNRVTEWAVREFQIYAGMERGARLNPKLSDISAPYDFLQLTGVEIPADKRYQGAISGVVNKRTAELIKFWLDEQQNWRCPVIACAFEREPTTGQRKRTGRVVENGDNLWSGINPYGTPGVKAQVYVRDFTRYYCESGPTRPPEVQFLWVAPDLDFKLELGGTQLPLIRSGLTTQVIEDALKSTFSLNFKVVGQDNGPWEIRFLEKPNLTEADLFKVLDIPENQTHIDILPEWLAVGDFAKYGSSGGPLSSPPRHCWAEYGGEILPEPFMGEAATDINRSTFRVVRAVSEVECNGFFDSLNAYDTGLISLGPAHWILGLKSEAAIAAGELGGFLAYLKFKQAETFRYAFGRFGVELVANWKERGKNLLNSSNRTYTNWIRLQTEDGFTALSKIWDEANWFKSWHWFYRFVMAGRLRFAQNGASTNPILAGYRQAMWDMARIRLRDILSAEWPQIDGQQLTYIGSANAAGGAGPRNARAGDIFSSELSVALLMRWHINVPSTVLRNGKAGKHLVAILKTVKDNTVGADFSNLDWVNSEATQTALIDSLIERVSSDTVGPLADPVNKPGKYKKSRDNLIGTLTRIRQWLNSDDVAGENAKRENQGYKLRRNNSDYRLVAEKGLESKPNSFTLYLEGIEVAVINPVIKSYTAIPITDPPIADENNNRFGISLLGRLLDGNQLEFLGMTLNMCFPDPPPIEPLQDGNPQDNEEDVDDNDPPLHPLDRPGFFGLRLPIRYLEDPERPLLTTDLVEALENFPNEDLQIFNDQDAPDQQSVEIRPLVSEDRTALGKHQWSVDLGDLVDPFLGFTPAVSVLLENGQTSLIVQISHPLLTQPLRWTLDANGATAPSDFVFTIIEEEGNNVARFTIPVETPLLASLPLFPGGTVRPSLQIDCLLSLEKGDRNFKIRLVLDGVAEIDLGSPLAHLSLTKTDDSEWGVVFSAADGLQLVLPDGIGASLRLDLFEKIGTSEQGAVVNNIWSKSDVGLVKLDLGQLVGLDEAERTITWRNSFPRIPQRLLEKWLVENLQNAEQLLVDQERRLQSIAGSVLGALIPTQVTFDKCEEAKPFEFQIDTGIGKLRICLRLKVSDSLIPSNEILIGDGKFAFLFKIQDGFAEMEPGSFRCEGETLIQIKQNYNWSVSELISLHVPRHTAFRFISQPNAPRLVYAPDASYPSDQKTGSPARISIRVPASEDYRSGKGNPREKPEPNRFTFELEEFALHSGGYDLKGSVCAEKVPFTDGVEPIFAEPLAVKSPARNENDRDSIAGQLEFKNSRLIQGSLQASAKLPYFDDAIGTFTLFLAQDPVTKRIDAEGSFEISGLSEFHVDRLYLSCLVRALHLSVRYENKTWTPDAWITGQIKFAPPQGISAGTMKELSDLFSGVEFGFEQLNPLKLGGKETIRLNFPAKQFGFADVFDVKLNGVEFRQKEVLRLLGAINIKQLPGVNASLQFGDITLTQGSPPSFQVGRIGAQFDVPGGFRLDGDFQFVELEAESGFVGAFALKTETLEGSGLLKLTRVRTVDRQAWVPSLAVYLETDIDVALFAGFFLRSLGVGLGIYQALDGLEPDPKRTLPQKIGSLVNNPAGLPVPRRPESWKPARPEKAGDRLNWMVVANGLITLGKLPNDKPHPIAGSILLAVDQDLQIVAGVNLWLFASPDDTRRVEFAAKPVGRGAIGLSVKEQRLFAMFRTLKQPRFRNDAPPILKEVLSKVETSLFFSADRKGMLVEVGWPWETRIRGHALGDLIRGELVSGFRFGIYQGIISFGLNYAVSIVLRAETRVGFDTRLGSAEALLSAKGQGMFRASFAGALDRQFRTYLVGDVRIQATLALTAQASVSLSKRFTRWFKISISIRFKVTIQISIAAALTAAMEPGPNLGFTGEAEVAVSVCGYRLAGRLAFASRSEVIGRVRNQIKKLLPPNLAAQIQRTAAPMRLLANRQMAAEQQSRPWTYHFHKVPGTNTGPYFVRVLLFPSPGTPYPKPGEQLPRFSIQLQDRQDRQDKVTFNGFVGSEDIATRDGSTLSWSERLEEKLPIASSTGPATDLTEAQLAELADLRKVKNVLKSIQVERTDFRNTQEISDSRPLNPSPDHTDDETKAIAPNTLPSPNLARNTLYDQQLASAWLRDPTIPRFQLLISENLTVINPAIQKLEELAAKGDSAETVPDELLNLFRKATEPVPPVLPQKIFVSLLPDTEVELFKAIKVWRIDPLPAQDSKDQSDSKGYFVAQQDNQIQIIPNNYIEAEAEQGISAGMLLAELLEILGDNQAQVGKDYVEQDGEAGFAHRLNLILQFEVPEKVYKKGDPVPDIINLNSGIRIENQELESLDSPLGKGVARPEYDLVAGPVAQSNDQICLTWLFLREDPSIPEGGSDVDVRRPEDPAVVFAELQKFAIMRRNFNRPGDKPQEYQIYQTWIKGTESEAGPETLIRPPFQFVDNQLEGIQEGDLLQYQVVAKAPDRILTSCLINVVRRKVIPLPPPGQALALHHLRERQIEIVVPAVARDVSGKTQVIGRENLLLQYRFVQAGTVGSYGFETRPEVSTEWLPGLPARVSDEDVQIEFASVRETLPIPWDETENLPLEQWQTIPPDSSDGLQQGYFVVIQEVFLEETLKEKWQRPGWAIEFYVGHQIGKSDAPKIERSVLQKCRHAILPLPLTDNKPDEQDNEPDEQDVSPAERLDLSRGNGVEALEYIALELPENSVARWLDPKQLIDYRIDYNPSVVELTLAWRHDLSGRSGYDNPLLSDDQDQPRTDSFFDPVVGYQLYRHDRYDPNPPAPTAEVIVRAVPDLLYRAQPASISVKGLADQPDPTTSRPQAPTMIEEEVRDRLDRGLKQAEGNQPPCADWVPSAKIEDNLTVEFPIVTLADGEEPPPPFQWTEVQPGGQIWLHQEIQAFLKQLTDDLQTQTRNEVRYVLFLRDPLMVQKYDPSRLGETDNEILVALDKAIQNLAAEFNDKTDPYGWRTLESLGLACECRFITVEGRPIPTETVMKSLQNLQNNPRPVSVGIFLAEDHKTRLDVLRLVYARTLKVWTGEPQRPFNLDIILSHRFLGSDKPDNRLSPEQQGFLINTTQQWLNQLNPRLQRSKLIQEEEEADKAWRRIMIYRYDARTTVNEGQPNDSAPQSVVALPIQQDGRLECQFTVPDRWAHQYQIALALVRRYDLALGRVTQFPPQVDRFIEISVDRSHDSEDNNRLVPHNLLATPLNGSIQAIVFRHPAAFAAAASAVQAAHIQYSGTTVHLQRRIKDQDKLQAVYDRFFAKLPELKWQDYQAWLERTGKEQVSPDAAPDLVKKDGTPGTPDLIKPIPEVISGIYGADRYVYPDLPGYYEYRVVAYSTAGRSKSSPKATTWVSPLYQSNADARLPHQIPHAEQCRAAIYDDAVTRLTLQIPLVHPRQHMREEVSGLWVDADRVLSVANGIADDSGNIPRTDIRFGSLPDLHLTYQAYLWINGDTPNVSRVFLPLLRILPPDLQENGAWFKVEPQFPQSSQEPIAAALLQVEGELVFNLTITFERPQADTLITALQAETEKSPDHTVTRIIPIVVQRNGIWSELPKKLLP